MVQREASEEARERFRKLKCSRLFHTWTSSCSDAWIEILKSNVVYSTRLYTAVHGMSFLLRGKLDPKRVVTQVVPNILRSSLFLTCIGGLLCPVQCLSVRLFGNRIWNNGFLPGLVCGSALIIESETRRSELTLFMISNALVTMQNAVLSRMKLVTGPLYDTMLACIALSITMREFVQNPEGIRGLPGAVVRLIFRADGMSSGLKKGVAATARAVLLGAAMKAGLEFMRSMRRLYAGRPVAPPAIEDALLWPSVMGSSTMAYTVTSAMTAGLGKTKSATIAGAIAGLPFIFSRMPELAVLVCMPGCALALVLSIIRVKYVAVKAIESGFGSRFTWLYRKRWPKAIDGNVTLMALSVGVLMHYAVTGPHVIPANYWQFCLLCTQRRFNEIDRCEFDKLGYDGTQLYRETGRYHECMARHARLVEADRSGSVGDVGEKAVL